MLGTWRVKGELILNCNCMVFCPCVVSLGRHPPTEGHCHAWLGVHVEEGHADKADLAGLNVAMLLDIPGQMAHGNWTAAAFIDERAGESQFDGLMEIFTGRAKGTTGLLGLLVGTFLGAERAPVEFVADGPRRRLNVGKKIVGEIEPIEGSDPGREVKVVNTQYWMGSDVTIAKANKGRVRAFGRVWDFEGLSAEILRIDWKGP